MAENSIGNNLSVLKDLIVGVGEATVNRAVKEARGLGGILKESGNIIMDTDRFLTNEASKLISRISAAPEAQRIEASQGQPTQQTAEMIKALRQKQEIDELSLDPIQKVALDTAKKITARQMEEAADIGVPVIDMLKQVGINPDSQDDKPGIKAQADNLSPVIDNSAISATNNEDSTAEKILQQSINQAISGQDKSSRNVFQKIIDFLPGGAARMAEEEEAVLSNLLKKQKLLGKEPLQEGRREELGLNFINNTLAKSGKSKLSPDAVKNLENAKLAVSQTSTLMEEFDKDPNLFKTYGGAGDARGQQVNFMRKNLSDTIGRLRSGGAINDEENKTFMSFIPKQGLIKGRLEDNETVMFKLRTLNKLFSGVVEGLMPAEEASGITQKIQEALDNGYTPSEISKFIGF